MFVAALAALVLIGCASSSEVRLQGSPQAPAAEGTLKLSRGQNGNTHLEITVRHMAPPDRMTQSATVYVVWVRPIQEGSVPQNLGALQVNDKLEGTLDTLTPLHSFDLMVTAEPSATVVQPSGIAILSTSVNRS